MAHTTTREQKTRMLCTAGLMAALACVSNFISIATPASRIHIGNAVCVPVVQWVAGRISTTLQSRNDNADSKKSTAKKQLQYLAETFLSPESEGQQLRVDSEGSKWKSGGIAYKDCFVTVGVSSSPKVVTASRLLGVIEKTKVHERYFLSTNAVQGILRRVDKLGRHLFPPLNNVLRQIAAPNPAMDENALEAPEDVQARQLVAL